MPRIPSRGPFARAGESAQKARRRRATRKALLRPEAMEARVLLAYSIVDVQQFEGNGGPATYGGRLEPGSEADVYRIDGTAGQRLLFDALTDSSGVNWSLYDGGGQVIAGAGFAQNNDFEATLPATGPYTLVLIGNPGGDAVDYKFRVFDITKPPVALSGLQADYTGTISGAETKTYTFTAPAGTRLYLDSLEDSSNGLYISVIGPSNDYVVGGTYARSDFGPFSLSESGTYTIAVAGYSNSSGTYHFRLLQVPADAQPLGLDQAQGVTLDPPYSARLFTFQGAAGQGLYYDGLTGTTDATLTLFGPSGRVVGGFGSRNASGDVRFELPEAGTYVLVASSNSGAPQSFGFRLANLPSGAAALPLDQDVSGTLDPAYGAELYRFNGAAGQRLYFDSSTPFSYYQGWTLYGPGGDVVFGSYLAYDQDVTLPFDGPYVLAINDSSGTPSDFAFRVVTPETTTQYLTPNAVASGAIGEAGERDVYTFTGTPGQRVYFDGITANNATATLVSPTGQQVFSVGASSNGGPFVLTDPGTYRLAVNGNGDSTGDYSFQLLDLGAVTTLVPGTTYSGTLDPGSRVAAFRFNGQAGEARFFDQTLASPVYPAAYWTLLGPDGQAITSNFYGSDLAATLPRDGEYNLVITGNFSTPVDYQFRMLQVPATASATLALGQDVNGSIDVPGEQDAYTFTGTAGQLLLFDGVESGASYNLQAALFDAAGNVISPVSGTYLYSDAGPFLLGHSGTYRLVVYGAGDATGAYRFRLLDLAAATAISTDADVQATLPAGPTATPYRFAGTAGQRVYIDTMSADAPAALSLIRPDGSVLTGTYISYGEDLEATLPESGTYYLIASNNSDSANALSFRVITPETTKQALTLGQVASGSIGEKGEVDEYTFTGSPGQRLFYDGLAGPYNLHVVLIDPTGYGTGIDTYAPASDVGPVTLTASGTYRLIIDGNGDATGAYSFRLLDLATAATALSLPATLDATLADGQQADLYTFDGTAGQRIYLDGREADGPNVASLYGPNGLISQTNLPNDLELVLPADGRYVLAIRGFSDTPVSYKAAVYAASTTTAALALNATTTATIAGIGDQAAYTFDGTAGQFVFYDALGASDGLYVQLVDPFGNAYGLSGNAASDAGPFVLPYSGPYRLIVDGAADAVGTADFQLLSAPGLPTLALDAGLSGTLDPGTKSAGYEFLGTAGQRLSFHSPSNSGASDLAWALYGLNGWSVTGTTYGIGTDFAATLPADGRYVLLLIGQQSAANPTSYTIRATDVTGAPVAASGLGRTITGSITAPGQVDTYTFDAPAGQRIAIVALHADFNYDSIQIEAPSGAVVYANYAVNDSPPVVLPESGTYTLTVTNALNSTGDYAFRLQELPVDAAWLTLGDATAGTMAAHQPALLRFTGTAGHQLYLDVLDAGAPTISATLYAPSNAARSLGTLGYDSGPITLTESGTYYLFLSNDDGSDRDYGFRLIDLAQAPATGLTLGQDVAGSINPGAGADLYTFDGTAGQQLLFDSSTEADYYRRWALILPNGTTLFNDLTSSDQAVTLPASGTYTLAVSNINREAYDYAFRVVPITTTTAGLALGSAVSGSIGAAGERDEYTFTGSVGQILYFDGLAGTPDLRATLYAPSGAVTQVNLALPDDAGPFTLAEPGTYRLVVSGVGGSTGSYGFRLIDLADGAPLPLGVDVAGTLAPGTGTQFYQFTGEAGEQLYYDGLTGEPSNTFLFGPDGRYLTRSYSTSNDFEYTLPYTGTYYLYVSGQGAADVSYSFRLTKTATRRQDIALGQDVNGSIDAQGQVDEYDLAVVPGQVLFFDALGGDNSITTTVYDPSGAYTGMYTFGPWQDLGPFTAARAGTYRFIIQGHGATGAYHFQVFDLSAGTTVTPNTDVTGTLSPGLRARAYRVSGAAGQRIYIDGLDTAGASIGLFDADGNSIASGYLANDLELTLPRNSDYTLLVTNNGNADATYAFRIDLPQTTTQPLTFGQVVAGSLDVPGDQDVYTFTGTVGQRVFFDGLTGTPGLVAVLYGPSGEGVFTTAQYFYNSIANDYGTYTLPASGTYRLVVDAGGDATGPYSFRLLNASVNAAARTLPATLDGTLTDGHQADLYSFSGTAGQRLAIDGQSPYNGTTISVYDPNNNNPLSVNIEGYAEFTLPATGTYLVAVRGNSDVAVDYKALLRFATTTTQPLTLNSTVTGTLAGAGDVAEYTFTGTPGQRIYFDSISADGGLTRTLYDPYGHQLLSNYYYTNGDAGPITLTEAGTYTLRIDGGGNATGNFQFRLLDASSSPIVQVGAGKMTFTVHESDAHADPISVYFTTSDGTANTVEDYVARSGYLTFAPGVQDQTIVVPIVGDLVVEPDEVFYVDLNSPSNGTTIDKGRGVGTILNDDTASSLAIDDATVVEGDSGTRTVTLTVTLSPSAGGPVTVQYTTRDGTATAGSDYVAQAGTLNFAPGETIKTIDIAINGDTVAENDEVFYVDLSGPDGAIIADATGQVTIRNDDATLAIDDVTINEGDSGTTPATFTVTLSAPSAVPVTVEYYTEGSSATSPSDFAAASGTLTFNPGETSKAVTIGVVGDATPEPDEQFLVRLRNPNGATISRSVGVGTIRNDDAAFSIADAYVVEGDSGTRDMTFTVSIPYATTNTVTVHYATADGTATAGSDYTANAGDLTFAPGEMSKSITVAVLGDTTPEPDEAFVVNLSSPANAAIARVQATGTILNDDTTIAVASIRVVEGDAGTTDATFTVRLTAPSSQTVTVHYATADGTATAGSDYTATSGDLSFAPGVTELTVSVPVLGDAVVEPDEAFSLVLSGATNALIANTSAAATILNDDAAVSIADASVVEGDSGTRGMTFVVSIAQPSVYDVTVHYVTADGTATAGSDYTATSGTAVIPAGSTASTITVPVLGDAINEGDETFSIALDSPAHASIARGTAIGTILDDDALPALAINDVSVVEGDAGTVTATFTVTLTGTTSRTVTVGFATLDGTATAGADYLAGSGTLSLAPGELSKTIAVTVLGDRIAEGNETFTLRLSGAANAAITRADGTGTILDDDHAGIVVTPTSGLVTTEAGGTATFRVRLASQPTADVVIHLASSDTTEGVVAPLILSFTAANWGVEQVVTVTGVDDDIVDGDVAYTILTEPASSADPNYDGLDAADVSATNRDDDRGNTPPVAVDDRYAAVEDETLTVTAPAGVLANDHDAENDPLSAVLVAPPAHGQLTLKPDGSFTYRPVANYHGTDTFTYRADDGTSRSGVATVTVDVASVNDPPVAVDDTAATDDQTPVTIDVLANDTDADLPDDELTIVAVGTPSPNVGTVRFTGTAVTYTPTADTQGPVTFTYTVRDRAGATSTATVTVNVRDVTAPRLVDVIVHWGSQSTSVKDMTRNLPWAEIRSFDLVFSEDVQVSAADLKLTGKQMPTYAFSGFSYSSSTRTARWDLPTALGVDQLMLLLDGDDAADGVLGVRDLGGNFLAGGDYLKSLRVLPGDFDDDGVVTVYDAVKVRNLMTAATGVYALMADLNGDGVVDLQDILQAQRRIGNKLPSA